MHGWHQKGHEEGRDVAVGRSSVSSLGLSWNRAFRIMYALRNVSSTISALTSCIPPYSRQLRTLKRGGAPRCF